MSKIDFFNWCIDRYEKTNRPYHDYLPYRFHLELVHIAACDFKQMWDGINEKQYHGKVSFEVIECGCYAHDLISDTGTNYNDIKRAINSIYSLPVAIIQRDYAIQIPEIARAVCEDVRGRNREERMPDYIYKEIRETPGATMVKLADRIGNVRFGKFMGGEGMFQKYKKEYSHFKEMLYDETYNEMWFYLESLLFT